MIIDNNNFRLDERSSYPVDNYGNCVECGGGYEGSIDHDPSCIYIKKAVSKRGRLAAYEALRICKLLYPWRVTIAR